jgi:hypothetical protein
LVQVYFKRFGKVKWKIRRSKRLNTTSRKRSHLSFQKMRKEYLKDKILREAHEFAYSIHPGGNKMYHDLKSTYWWYGMKRDVAEYVALCDTCQ